MTDTAIDLPIGFPLPDWQPARLPERRVIDGVFARLEPLGSQHTADLFEADLADHEGVTWTYMPDGPFPTLAAYQAYVTKCAATDDPLFFAIVERATNRALGMASFMRISPAIGSIEIGWIHFSPALQQTVLATESLYLMMRESFVLGNRRLEWKCDSLNAASNRAAIRLGFKYEGLFRQATIYKNRNRDTCWYSILDCEWPRLDRGYQSWLAECAANNGVQKRSLAQAIDDC
ncbi:MAG: GNAT family protein [Candidatus Pacebacteria bacterium]|nr:GNAT family protein [Candidatus Paceibacterota bacterium]